MKRIEIENRTDLKSEIPLKTPYCIYIDPSNACNFKCSFCMNSKIKSPQIMRMDVFKKIVDDLQEFENPIKTVKLYGFGEPLVNPYFCEMVRYAKSSNKILNVSTTTNASLLTSKLIDELVDSGIDRINVSVESIGTESYRRFTNNKNITYEQIVESASELFRKRKNTVVFVKINGDYLTEKEKNEFTNTFTPISNGCDIEHTMNCWRDFEVKEVNTKVGLYGNELKEVQVCPYVQYSFMIHSDGLASACFLDWNKKLIIGDAKNESVKSLWNDKVFEHLKLQMLRKERKNHPVCKNCNQLIAGMPVNLDDHSEEILSRM